MRKVTIGGKVQVSGLCLGGNPFSGFSHQNPERSQEMTRYFTPERIKETLRAAENAGINTLFARADDHIISVEALDMIREGGVSAGFSGHKPESHEWIRNNLDVDFQMCCHYNPTDRTKSPHHISVDEKWNDEDRDRMVRVITTIEKPVVHFKVFAGGNKPIIPAFELLGRAMRKNDVVCVGMFTKDDPDMIRKNVALFEKHVDKLKVKG